MANQYVGIIKSYGLKKGFGFIMCDDIPGEEVFFARRALAPEIVEAFEERLGLQLAGKSVTFTAMQAENGKLQATQVCIVAGEGDEVIGRVKSYNGAKGFGFLASASVQGDVFFSKRELPGQCQSMELNGAAAKFKLTFAADGKPQARQVVPQGQQAAAMPPMAALPWSGGMGMGPMAMMGMGGKGAWALPSYAAGFGKGGYGGYGGPGGYGGYGGKGGGYGHQPQQHRDRAIYGVVKNFDAQRGFGFILSPEVPNDIYFKGHGAEFSNGDRVCFYLQYTPDGKPQGRAVAMGYEDGDVCQGSVKSYNPNKGFGFLTVADKPGDVYFKKEQLPAGLQDEELIDRVANFTVHLATDGKPQVQEMEILDGELADMLATSNGGGTKRARTSSFSSPGRAPFGAEGPIVPPAKRIRPPPAPVVEVKDEVDTAAMEGAELEGVVKSYNPSKGFGFIRSDSFPTDIYFKGYHPEVAPGSLARLSLRFTPDGKPQASTVEFIG